MLIGRAGGHVVAGGTVTLSGEFVNAANSGADAIARVTVDLDGNVYRTINQGARVQIDTGTDWVRPVDVAPGAYRVRYTGLSGDPLTNAPAAEDVWQAIAGADRIFDNIDSGPTAPDSLSTSFTMEIDKGGGTALDTGIYILVADREDI